MNFHAPLPVSYKAESLFKIHPVKLFWRYKDEIGLDVCVFFETSEVGPHTDDPQLKLHIKWDGDVHLNVRESGYIAIWSSEEYARYLIVLAYIHNASYKHFSQFDEDNEAFTHGKLPVGVALLSDLNPLEYPELQPCSNDLSCTQEQFEEIFKES